MAKLKFGAWIPTYAWSGKKTDPKNMRRIRESIVKCEKYGIDVWVIDHLLSAPGLYGNAWLEPLGVLSYAAALTSRVKIATGRCATRCCWPRRTRPSVTSRTTATCSGWAPAGTRASTR